MIEITRAETGWQQAEKPKVTFDESRCFRLTLIDLFDRPLFRNLFGFSSFRNSHQFGRRRVVWKCSKRKR